MQRKRAALCAVLVALLVGTSGCMGLLAGDEPTRFVASEASVGSDALEATGYQLTTSSWENVTREVGVEPVTREIEVANYVNGYERETADGESAGGFAVLSTPQAEIAGQAVNPIRTWSPRRLLAELQTGFTEYGELRSVSQTGSRSVSILGVSTEVTAFTAVGRDTSGEDVEVVLHVARVRHAGDYIVAASIREAATAGEQERLNQLFLGIVHAAAAQLPAPALGPINGIHAPTVDGVLYGHTGQSVPDGRAAEWSDGQERSVTLRSADGQQYTGTLYTKYVGESLYVGIHVPELAADEVRRASIVLDRNGDGETSADDARVTLHRTDSGASTLAVETLRSDGYIPASELLDLRGGELARRTGQTASAGFASVPGGGVAFEARVTPAELEALLGEGAASIPSERGLATLRQADEGDGEENGNENGNTLQISYTVQIETTSHVFVVVGGSGGGGSPVIGPGGFSITELIETLIIDFPDDSSVPGTGTSDPRAGDAHVEVFQTVQNRSNDFPLAQGKDTLVRAFVEHQHPDLLLADVDASVYNTTGGAYTLTGSDFDTYRAPPIPDRTNWDHAANLEFSGSAFDHESVLVEVEFRFYPNGRSGPGFPHRVVWTGNLTETYEPNVYYLRVRNSSRNMSQVPQSHADLVEQRVRQSYPIRDMQFVDVGWEALGNFTQGSGGQLVGGLDSVAATISAGNLATVGSNPDPVDQVFGVTRRGGGLSDPAWGNGNSRASWGGLWSSSGGFVMAHEIQHNIGNNTYGRHVGDGQTDDPSTPNVDESTANGCGASGVDQRWQQLYPTNVDIQEVGWNPTDDWVTADYPDVMGYCTDSSPRKWISTYRWVRLFERFETFQAGQPVHPDLQSGGGSGGSGPDEARAASTELFDRRVPTVRVVTGTLTPDGEGALDTSFEQPGRAPEDLSRAVPEPTAELVVRYTTGEQVRLPLGVPRVTSEGDPVTEWPFTVTVPDGGLITEIRLETTRGRLLDSQRDSEWQLGGGELATPEGFERGETVRVVSRLERESDRELTRRLLYTPDGERYYPYGPAFTGDNYPATFSGLPGGDRARFLLLVSDGLRTHFVESDPFRVPHRPPTVDIHWDDRYSVTYETSGTVGRGNAVEGSVQVREDEPRPIEAVAGETVAIAASAHDERGAALGDEQLQWRVTDESGTTLDRGHGEEFSHQFLAPGTYEMTVTGTDNDRSASDSVTVVVDPPELPSVEVVRAFRDAVTDAAGE